MEIERRSLLRAGAIAWATPVILLAAPAPAAAASAPIGDLCDNGTIRVVLIERQQYQSIQIFNLTAELLTVAGTAESASPHLEGICGADTFQETTPGNGVFSVAIPGGGSVTLSILIVQLERPGPTGFIFLPGCLERYPLTSVTECPADNV